MTPGINHSLDPSICSCFPSSYQNMSCNKFKWSTISISMALLLIIVYASSGLYTLIDVTTFMSTESFYNRNETIFWSLFSSSTTVVLSWISLCVYFSIVLFVIILLCGIQLNKPYLLFLWSILMIVMLLIDGIVTVLSLRQHQQQGQQTSSRVKILFCLMIVRLAIMLCSIFLTVFHFRQLNKAKSEYLNRQRMLLRYQSEGESPSYDSSWTRSSGLVNPAKDLSDEHFIGDLSVTPPPISLPRAKVATIQRHPLSSMLHSRNSVHLNSENIDHTDQLPLNDYNEQFQYNIPLQDKFHQQKITNMQEL